MRPAWGFLLGGPVPEGSGFGIVGAAVAASAEAGEVFHDVAHFGFGENRAVDLGHAARGAVAFGDVVLLHLDELVVGVAEREGGGGLGCDDAGSGTAGFEGEDNGVVAGGDPGVGLDDGLEEVVAVILRADFGEVGAGFATALGADFVAAHTGEDGLVVEDFFAAGAVATAEGDLEGGERVGIFCEEGVAGGEEFLDFGFGAECGGVEDVELDGGGDFAGGKGFELLCKGRDGERVAERAEGAKGGFLLNERALGDEVGEDGRGGVR